jgi:hypothetical protein
MGFNAFIDRSVSLEARVILERGGRAVVAVLAAGEKRWKSGGTTLDGREKAAPPSTASPAPARAVPPSSAGEGGGYAASAKAALRGFSLRARKMTLKILDWTREKVAGKELKEDKPAAPESVRRREGPEAPRP